jgi:HlyD family secretion protein
MNAERLGQLALNNAVKQRRARPFWLILMGVLALTAVVVYLAWPREEDQRRLFGKAPGKDGVASVVALPDGATNRAGAKPPGDTLLTVSGYIINRERIELSPRFLGVVQWIGVKKGDAVTNGQVLVRLDDAEQRARVLEAGGRLANAEVAVEKAQLDYERVLQLRADKVESKEREDAARLQLESARATVQEVQGALALARAYLDWTVIRSPIDGVVLEKLVDPNELVVPQSFGGTRGPSTALVALADPNDLQVEIDLNEADLSKVFLNQKCRVSPEAYPDRHYDGYVAEIAPEANRQKGTLQIKVQILRPDRFLTPELSARVDFLPSRATPPAQ